MSLFRARSIQGVRFDPFKVPRRPRHRMLRWVFGAAGVAVLVGFLFLSVFVGIAMLAVGLLVRMMRQHRKPISRDGDTIAADYRVVSKAELPLAR